MFRRVSALLIQNKDSIVFSVGATAWLGGWSYASSLATPCIARSHVSLFKSMHADELKEAQRIDALNGNSALELALREECKEELAWDLRLD